MLHQNRSIKAQVVEIAKLFQILSKEINFCAIWINQIAIVCIDMQINKSLNESQLVYSDDYSGK